MTNKYQKDYPSLVYANARGEIFDYQGLNMAGRSGYDFFCPNIDDLIPLPYGSELFVIPDSVPIAWDPYQEDFVLFDTILPDGGGRALAVAAFMAPAYTQTALCAFERESKSPPLPLFAYTAVGWWKGRFWVAGFRSDKDRRQDPKGFKEKEIIRRTKGLSKRFKRNRLVQHLTKCSLTYGCPAAKNFFLGRFEAPIPTSPICNARCLGCLSLQTKDGPPPTQDRISFTPSAKEIKEMALFHLRNVKGGIVSFGQGCEGEPLLQHELLSKAIHLIRKEHKGGTINLNSNSSLPDVIPSLRKSGLDSIRISLNSVFEDYYHAYYRPKGYSFEHVLKTWQVAKEQGLHVSLNLFVLPGLTDLESHVDKLSELIEKFGLDLIQLRNHNIDPIWYLKKIEFHKRDKAIGIKNMVKILKERFPHLRFGYFNPSIRE